MAARPDLPGISVPLGMVVVSGLPGFVGVEGTVLVPEGMGISGVGTTVGRVLEEVVGLMVVGVVSPMLRQPAKRTAIKTKISVMMHAFFMLKPPVVLNTRLVLLRITALHPGK